MQCKICFADRTRFSSSINDKLTRWLDNLENYNSYILNKMTEKLAKEIFDAMITELLKYDMTDIVTFRLNASVDQIHTAEFSKAYQFRDTDSELAALIRLARSGDRGANTALRRLTRAGKDYFLRVKELSNSFDQKLGVLFSEKEYPSFNDILLSTGDNEIVDLKEQLRQPEIDKIKILFEFIDDHLELDDKTFMTELDRFLTTL